MRTLAAAGYSSSPPGFFNLHFPYYLNCYHTGLFAGLLKLLSELVDQVRARLNSIGFPMWHLWCGCVKLQMCLRLSLLQMCGWNLLFGQLLCCWLNIRVLCYAISSEPKLQNCYLLSGMWIHVHFLWFSRVHWGLQCTRDNKFQH